MLYSTLVVAASAFAGFASAQNASFNTPIPCCTVPTNNVPQEMRGDWCTANEHTCVDLCGGQAQIASNGNTCDDNTLSYTCSCSNGTSITNDVLKNYQQSVPALMCRFWYSACINATGQDAAAQYQCNAARDSQCGNLTTKAADGIYSSSASPSSSATGSRTSGGASSSPTGSAAAATSSKAAAGIAQFGVPVLAGGLLAVFGFAL